MRWLSLLIASIGIVLSGTAFALPQPDAEAAYARGDYATAFKIWLPLAEQGSAQAQLNVARMYERGEWVAQDKQAATEWYSRAAAQSARDGTMPGAPDVASAGPGRSRHRPCRRRRPIRGRVLSIPRRRLPFLARPFFGLPLHGHPLIGAAGNRH